VEVEARHRCAPSGTPPTRARAAARRFDIESVKRALAQASQERKPEWRATEHSPGNFVSPA
jgi:hypothetical protein